jgi:hypothetical protein
MVLGNLSNPGMAQEHKVPWNDFRQSHTPAAQRSKLLGYWDAIKAARAEGFTYQQICDWLKLNDVEMTYTGLAKFVKVQTEREERRGKRATPPIQDETDISHHQTGSKLPATSIGPPPISGPKASPTEKKAQRDRTAALFIRDDKNSVLENLKDTQE